MKKLLLFLLPLALVSGALIRAEDQVAPASGETVTAPVPVTNEIDPRLDSFRTTLNAAMDACKAEMGAIQDKFAAAFTGQDDVMQYMAENFQSAVMADELGNKYLLIQVPFGIPVPPAPAPEPVTPEPVTPPAPAPVE